MSTYFDTDEIFGDLEKTLRKLLDSAFQYNSFERMNGSDMKRTNDPEMEEYASKGRIEPEPLEPVEPYFRRRRPPFPGRFVDQGDAPPMIEPLVDVFDCGDEVKIYLELPNAVSGDVKLGVTEGGIEVKTKDFYKVIRIPLDIDIGQVSSVQRNRVLEVTLPKRRKSPPEESHRIVVE